MVTVKAIYTVVMSEVRDFDNGRSLVEYQVVHTDKQGGKHYRVVKHFYETAKGPRTSVAYVHVIPNGTPVMIVGEKRPNIYKDKDGNPIDKGTYIHVERGEDFHVLEPHTPEWRALQASIWTVFQAKHPELTPEATLTLPDEELTI